MKSIFYNFQRAFIEANKTNFMEGYSPTFIYKLANYWPLTSKITNLLNEDTYVQNEQEWHQNNF